MTTPERLRRRQLLESAGIAILALALCFATWYLDDRDDQQRECLRAYFANQAETSQVRSKLVEDESQATRNIITRAFSANDREDAERAFAAYQKALAEIDKERADNPVRGLPEGVCE